MTHLGRSGGCGGRLAAGGGGAPGTAPRWAPGARCSGAGRTRGSGGVLIGSSGGASSRRRRALGLLAFRSEVSKILVLL